MTSLVRTLALITIAALPLYVVRFALGPLPSTLLEVLLLVTVLVWLAQKYTSREPNKKLPRAFLITLGAFLVAATISIFTSPNLRAALGIWRAYFIEPILFFLVLTNLLQKKTLTPRSIITALAIPAITLSLYAIFQKLTGYDIPQPWDAERRVTSIFPYPNALALFLAPLIPLFLFQISKKHITRSMFFITTILLSLAAIIFAKSTGALVGLGGGVTITAIGYLTTKKHWKSLAATIAVLLTLGFCALQLKPVRNELLLNDWSGRVHTIGWNEGFTMLKDHPIFGAGLNGFPITLKPYHKAVAIEIFQYPHNIILNFWSETGLLGLASFMVLIVCFYIYAFKKIRTNTAILPVIAAMATILIHGLVDVPYFKNDLAVMFWIIYALALALQPTTHDQPLQ